MSKPTGFFLLCASSLSFSYSLFPNLQIYFFFCSWSITDGQYFIGNARTTSNKKWKIIKKKPTRVDDACDFLSKSIFSLTFFLWSFRCAVSVAVNRLNVLLFLTFSLCKCAWLSEWVLRNVALWLVLVRVCALCVVTALWSKCKMTTN